MMRLIVTLCGIFFAFNAVGHPYHGLPEDAPLAFIEHKTDDGRPIYTNIPKSCFSQGRLTCIQLHPVFKGPGTIRKPGS